MARAIFELVVGKNYAKKIFIKNRRVKILYQKIKLK